MKFVLIALCGIVVLFMGGCAVVTAMAFPFPLIPGGIAALNLAIIGVVLGWSFQWRPAFYILGVVDILIAAAALVTAASMGPQDQPFFWLAAAIFALKGVLSIAYAWRTAGGT